MATVHGSNFMNLGYAEIHASDMALFKAMAGAEIIQKTCGKLSGKLLVAEERAQIGHERHILNSGNEPSD
jgi:hypothetical protein